MMGYLIQNLFEIGLHHRRKARHTNNRNPPECMRYTAENSFDSRYKKFNAGCHSFELIYLF